eukprot:TRINITY_DN970_c1_g1_i2.p1 TRINITY_DN970_c1_g1~~TRINITY_DN970_c1_g1_i2.p1  ORF type:complete len:495 (+),score=64.98 TRINITY_DN970_c1_g1_i2:50-1534(+)
MTTYFDPVGNVVDATTAQMLHDTSFTSEQSGGYEDSGASREYYGYPPATPPMMPVDNVSQQSTPVSHVTPSYPQSNIATPQYYPNASRSPKPLVGSDPSHRPLPNPTNSPTIPLSPPFPPPVQQAYQQPSQYSQAPPEHRPRGPPQAPPHPLRHQASLPSSSQYPPSSYAERPPHQHHHHQQQYPPQQGQRNGQHQHQHQHQQPPQPQRLPHHHHHHHQHQHQHQHLRQQHHQQVQQQHQQPPQPQPPRPHPHYHQQHHHQHQHQHLHQHQHQHQHQHHSAQQQPASRVPMSLLNPSGDVKTVTRSPDQPEARRLSDPSVNGSFPQNPISPSDAVIHPVEREKPKMTMPSPAGPPSTTPPTAAAQPPASTSPYTPTPDEPKVEDLLHQATCNGVVDTSKDDNVVQLLMKAVEDEDRGGKGSKGGKGFDVKQLKEHLGPARNNVGKGKGYHNHHSHYGYEGKGGKGGYGNDPRGYHGKGGNFQRPKGGKQGSKGM